MLILIVYVCEGVCVRLRRARFVMTRDNLLLYLGHVVGGVLLDPASAHLHAVPSSK